MKNSIKIHLKFNIVQTWSEKEQKVDRNNWINSLHRAHGELNKLSPESHKYSRMEMLNKLGWKYADMLIGIVYNKATVLFNFTS